MRMSSPLQEDGVSRKMLFRNKKTRNGATGYRRPNDSGRIDYRRYRLGVLQGKTPRKCRRAGSVPEAGPYSRVDSWRELAGRHNTLDFTAVEGGENHVGPPLVQRPSVGQAHDHGVVPGADQQDLPVDAQRKEGVGGPGFVAAPPVPAVVAAPGGQPGAPGGAPYGPVDYLRGGLGGAGGNGGPPNYPAGAPPGCN